MRVVEKVSHTASHPVGANNQVSRDRQALISGDSDAVMFFLQRRDPRRSLYQPFGLLQLIRHNFQNLLAFEKHEPVTDSITA